MASDGKPILDGEAAVDHRGALTEWREAERQSQ